MEEKEEEYLRHAAVVFHNGTWKNRDTGGRTDPFYPASTTHGFLFSVSYCNQRQSVA